MTNQYKHKRWEPVFFLTMLLASLLGSSCQEQTLYHDFRAIPLKGWPRNDTLCFAVTMTDSQTQVRLTLDVRNRNTYPYRNLLLQLTQESPDGQVTHSDTLSLSLADRQGMWTGKGWGGLYQSRFPLDSLKIGKPGEYHIKICQVMPADTLTGLNDVGLLLEKPTQH